MNGLLLVHPGESQRGTNSHTVAGGYEQEARFCGNVLTVRNKLLSVVVTSATLHWGSSQNRKIEAVHPVYDTDVFIKMPDSLKEQ